MKKRLLSLLLATCMILIVIPQAVQATGTRKAHNCGGTATTVTSFEALAGAVADSNVTDIKLSTAGDTTEATWQWTQALTISREVHIFVEEGKKITLKPGEKVTTSDKNVTTGLFTTQGTDAHLILGNGTLTWTGDEDKAFQQGNYTVESTGGELIIDGGAVWKEGETATTAYFIDKDGNRTSYKNATTGKTASLITCPSGTLDIWGGVTLQNNQKTNGHGSAINMENSEKSSAPTLNLYGGVVQWCATTGLKENGTGAIYCGYPNDDKDKNYWLTYNLSAETGKEEYGTYGTVNLYAGGVLHNANYYTSNTGTDHSGDGTGIALDSATLNLYGGSVSYNCGDTGCSASGPAADGGGVGGRVAAQLNLYGGEITNNWTGGFGGGVCLWNSRGLLAGTSITENTSGYGGGIAIAGCSSDKTKLEDEEDVTFSRLEMTGGEIAYNEATNIDRGDTSSGVGGGICAGTAERPNGSVLDLKGGKIYQNKAQNGGGVAAYAGRVTALKMSGTAEIVGNAAYQNGGGAYFTNDETGYKDKDSNVTADYIHPLLEMSGAARIDTQNTAYFENVIQVGDKTQVPVRVTGNLNSSGTVAIFEFSEGFWDPTKISDEDKNSNHAEATEGLDIVAFDKDLDIQENKFALDHNEWYLNANPDNKDSSNNTGEPDKSVLELQKYDNTTRYWVRNGTAVPGNDNKEYYRIYDSLAEAFTEAEDGDTLYIF